ncbi:acyl-CoA synthetase (AMP-forming)/AMP-acid ligase II [Psychromicrobium silvestre]|uniref:Acyl-CoA synthetase (AMP-forming)/AMP-acid ligase II n=1 Tax=Psychromicrobium silvestre TaxID=1645614 RepID=A0A7Y9LTE9_9MICC|nr:long-chain fatty acid--CoA ligase [Psychromicrobium silvestre]NYE95262.1 acyl-CoA synthetase (AMP-forming)/AMP-acid ligase II [Psychromicrobium silvestre]
MRLTDYLDKGASLGLDAPCLRFGEQVLNYGAVQELSFQVAAALGRSGIKPGDKVAILSSNDPIAFASVFGISRAGAVWCPINPRNAAAENRDLLDLFDCKALIYKSSYEPLAAEILPELPQLTTLVCLDKSTDLAQSFESWLAGNGDSPAAQTEPIDDVVMLVGTGGTTGKPKGVMLTGHNLEAMSALTLMSYPFEPRPVYLALAPLTHAAGVLCMPVLALGGVIDILATPDLDDFLSVIEARQVTHTFLPPTLIYMLLGHPRLESTDLSSLQCFWYGAAPMSAARLEEALQRIGPMAQLFGQSEAPMMISTMAPKDHYRADGSIAVERLSSAGRPSPLVTLAIMDDGGNLLSRGERGEVVVRSPLVMAGYYKNPEATAEASRFGWHHTGDIGYLDEDNFLYIVDRAKDMIISGGFNVYSAEVEQALMQHPGIRDCGVIGLPDEKWGERVTAVLELQPDATVDPEELKAFVKERIGSVKTPKEILVWPDLPRSKLGKVLKSEIKAQLLS